MRLVCERLLDAFQAGSHGSYNQPMDNKLPAMKLKPLKSFDYSLVQRGLEGLLRNMDGDLRRRNAQESRKVSDPLDTRHFVVLDMFVRFAKNSYEAAQYLTASIPEDHNRKPSYVLILPTVNRQLLDLLFTVVYMLDDFPERFIAYEKAGWRESKEEYERLVRVYRDHPEWTEYLEHRKRLVERNAEVVSLTAEEEQNPKLIRYWGTPTHLMKQQTTSRDFLHWLYDWFYKDTSEQAHLSSSGLMHVTPFLLADVVGGEDEEITKNYVQKVYHFQHFSRTATVVVAIMNEINAKFALENDRQIAYIWAMLREHVPEADDLFKKRYEKMLGNA
jgi:hypothetical protein